MSHNSIREKDLALYFQEGREHDHGEAANSALKRTMDVVLSLCALIFLAPFLAPVALLIWLQDGGSPFYAQDRLGRDGTTFRVLKFRTMILNASERLQEVLDADPAARAEWERCSKLRNDPRITMVGAFLRKTSLDELPQLINILRGDMSIVGPRPIPLYEIEKYGSMVSYYKEVRPGLTGLWQISGRSDTTYAQRISMDVRYVRNWNIWMDARIIVMTLPRLLRGAY